MRILFVVPNVPSTIRPRPLSFIRELAKKHQVSVVCLSTNDADERYVSPLRQCCDKVEVIRVPKWQSLWNCLRALFSANSLRCAYFYSPRLRNFVRAQVDANRVDVLHAEHLKCLPMVKDVLSKVPSVFDAVDCLSMLETRRRTVMKNPLVRLFSWSESTKLARSEADATRHFDRVVISSPIDRQAYPVSPALRSKIEVAPNGVNLEYFAFRQFEPDKNLLVFCAKLDYFPNEDAALFFARNVWPLLHARRPELRLDIVGSRPPRSVRRLHARDNIRVTGSVSDVRPYLGRAWVALCPIRIRAGIQFKILEAMALGLPVVTTAICCEGLQVESGKHLLVADRPEAFASAVELLLDNVMLREKLIEAGRAYVVEHHNWAESVRILSNSYDAAIANFPVDRKRPLPVTPAHPAA